MDKLNRLVGRHRQWLPPSDQAVSSNFWQAYDQAEKLDADMKRRVKGSYGGFNPFQIMAYRDDDKAKQAAQDRIVAAIEETLLANKISPDFNVLENNEQTLLLLAA